MVGCFALGGEIQLFRDTSVVIRPAVRATVRET